MLIGRAPFKAAFTHARQGTSLLAPASARRRGVAGVKVAAAAAKPKLVRLKPIYKDKVNILGSIVARAAAKAAAKPISILEVYFVKVK